jgi:hypothetical protein
LLAFPPFDLVAVVVLALLELLLLLGVLVMAVEGVVESDLGPGLGAAPPDTVAVFFDLRNRSRPSSSSSSSRRRFSPIRGGAGRVIDESIFVASDGDGEGVADLDSVFGDAEVEAELIDGETSDSSNKSSSSSSSRGWFGDIDVEAAFEPNNSGEGARTFFDVEASVEDSGPDEDSSSSSS